MEKTPAMRKKAIAVAKDVLVQLKARRIKATRGIYLAPINRNFFEIHGDDLRTHLQDGMRCHVCAIGAAFVGYARKFDRAVVTDLSHRMIDTMGDCFTESELRSMENEFEGSDTPATTCLRSIMENIIAHRGVFTVKESA